MQHVICAHGVASNGCGCIFVCDWNNECIHMFSVKDGRYMGVVIKEGEQGLRKPREIRWCETTSLLVVFGCRNHKWFVTVINVK